MEQNYIGLSFKEDVKIDLLYSVHYFEYMNDYSFEGESHDFWEITYVDKGDIELTIDERKIKLNKGEIAFIPPNAFHDLSANGVNAPNLVVISFQCNSKCMSFFQDKVFTVGTLEKEFFSEILAEAKHAFDSPLNKTYLYEIERNKISFFGSEQLIRLYLEYIIISLYRRYAPESIQKKVTKTNTISKKFIEITKDSDDNVIYEQILQYLNQNITSFLSVDTICHDNLVSRTKLQRLFGKRHNCGVAHYFYVLKIEHSKELIREKKLNLTEISEYLGYSSLQYFSRQFKQITGMSPSEYSFSVKAYTEV